MERASLTFTIFALSKASSHQEILFRLRMDICMALPNVVAGLAAVQSFG
jgi:hypothetical protein